MRIVFLLLFTFLSISANSQVRVYESKKCFVTLGQSNVDYFLNGVGVTLDSIGGGDSLSMRLKTLWSTDTVPKLAFGRGGSQLFQSVGVADWNAASVNEYADSILLLLNGYKNAIDQYTTGTNPGFSSYRYMNKWAIDVQFILWIQGENDSQVLAQANAYEANLTAIIEQVRERWNRPSMPFVLVRLGGAYTGTYKATINTAMQNVAVSLDDVYIVNTDDMTVQDYYGPTVSPVHYNIRGAQKLQRKIFTVIQSNGL